MNLLHRLHFAFSRWRYGASYGCGRCHHSFYFHEDRQRCTVKLCPCRQYSIERVQLGKSGSLTND